MIFDEQTRSKLQGTRCVSKSGDLLVLHHSTDASFASFEKTNDIGFHFGSFEQAAKRRNNRVSRLEADDDAPWRTISAVLAIQNPLAIANDPGAWRFKYLAKLFSAYLSNNAKRNLKDLSEQFDREIEHCATKEPMAVKAAFAVIKEELTNSGFDGIVYRNDFENSGRAIEWSWIAFSDSQIIQLRGATNLKTMSGDNVQVGKPINLRGLSPKRSPNSNEEGKLERIGDVIRFRRAIEEWAQRRDLTPHESIPLDYEFKPGEYCNPDDLVYKVGVEQCGGLTLRVHSKTGCISLAWDRKQTESFVIDSFDKIETEDFIDKDIKNQFKITWKSAEAIDQLVKRLDDTTSSMVDHLHNCKQKINHTPISRSQFN